MKAHRRQLTFAAVHVGYDFEPLVRGELLAAMAAVLLRPSPDEQPMLDGWSDYVPPPFEWPKVGPAIVHYPLGPSGPRVEHPPGIVCDGCQWECDTQGWPLGACGRLPRRWCAWCRSLVPRFRWQPIASRCLDCASVSAKRRAAKVAQP